MFTLINNYGMVLFGVNRTAKTRIIIFLWISGCLPVFAQNPVVDEYLAKSGDYSGLYSGPVKREYHPMLYENQPYYKSTDFVNATLIYGGIVYPGQKIRLDLYTEELIVNSPGQHYNVILDSEKVDTVFAWGQTVVRLVPPEKSGLSTGFYSLLFDGWQLQVLLKEKVSCWNKIDEKTVKSIFNFLDRYYLCINGKYYPVKNKNSFIKLFPQYKKTINRFAKEKALNFKNDPHPSFALLAAYCEELLQSEQKP